MIKTLKKVFLAFVAGLSVMNQTGCSSGGSITTYSTPPPEVEPLVTVPTIATPGTSPFYSKDNQLTITGMCMTGNTVMIFGDAEEKSDCKNSEFKFQITKTTDGVYSFIITQINKYQHISTPVNLVWIKKSSITPPSITVPSISPFSSALSELVIEGNCESDSVISLSLDGAGTTQCISSKFKINLPKAADGDYLIRIKQTDRAGNSSSTDIAWKKHALKISPNNPTLSVNTTQQISFSGGSGFYSASLATNNSGGTFDGVSNIYKAGPLAYVTDTLTVTDSLGTKSNITITTGPGDPDHFALPSPNNNPSTQIIGKATQNPLQAKVVDQYGNGIPFYPVLFQTVVGDAVITSSPLQVTNLFGIAEVTISMGYSSLISTVQVSPASGVLPDLASSGKARLLISINSQSKGSGLMGSLFQIGSNPVALTMGDFNLDGYQDIAVVNAGDPSLGILIGKGNGLYKKMTKIQPVCDGPNGIKSGDFNGDNYLDLIIVCSSSNMISVFRGYGNGTFTLPTNTLLTPNEYQPVGLDISDLNNDNKLDVVIASAAGSTATVRFGAGDGSFSSPTEYTTGLAPSSIILVDISKTGKKDLIVTSVGDNLMYHFPNTGNGIFGAPNIYDTGITPVQIQSADLDGDNYQDIVVVNNASNEISVYLNDKLGALNTQTQFPVGVSPTSIAITDINANGKPDLLVTNSSDNSLSVLSGAGNGVFTNIQDYQTINNPVYVSSGNVNGDSYADLLILGSTNQLLEIVPTQSDGTFGYSTSVGLSPSSSTDLDFDNDGKKDLAIASFGTGKINILKGDGKGFFTSTLNLSTSAGPNGLISADLRGLGRSDLIVANKTAGNIQVFLNKGDGTYENGVIYSAGIGSSSLISQDFNRDGKLDLVVTTTGNNKIVYLQGVGDGTFMTGVSYSTAEGPAGLVAADFNGDSILDVATANESGGNVSILIGNGDGTFQTQIPYDSGTASNSIAKGDFNGDGIIDLAVTNNSTSMLSILTGQGDGTMSLPNAFSCGNYPAGVVVGDLNSDGKLDISVTNGNDGTFTTLFGGGNGSFYDLTTYSTHSNTSKITISDFNSDGNLDLAISDLGKSLIQIWLGQ